MKQSDSLVRCTAAGRNLNGPVGLGFYLKPISCGQEGFMSLEATPNGFYCSDHRALKAHISSGLMLQKAGSGLKR